MTRRQLDWQSEGRPQIKGSAVVSSTEDRWRVGAELGQTADQVNQATQMRTFPTLLHSGTAKKMTVLEATRLCPESEIQAMNLLLSLELTRKAMDKL